MARHLQQNTACRVHFWPFDGWSLLSGCSVLAEMYPALWNGTSPNKTVRAISTSRTPSPLGRIQRRAAGIIGILSLDGRRGGWLPEPLNPRFNAVCSSARRDMSVIQLRCRLWAYQNRHQFGFSLGSPKITHKA
jgi:hypothetical protein